MSDTRTSFFQRKLEWSRWKHQILEKYLRVWVYKLSSQHPELAFVDACAGAGVYGAGDAGSPLLAIRYNDEQVLQKRYGRLVVHACEADPENAESLRRVLAPWLLQRPPRAIVYDGDFNFHLPQILQATRPIPTLFFIDPYGMRALSSDNLRPLLADRRRASTEVLVRVDPVMFARFSGWLKQRERDARGAKTAVAFRELLAGFNINVREIEASLETYGEDGAPDRMDMFGAYLRLFKRRFRYVQVIPIRPDYYAAPKYFLVHGTDSPDGAAKINDTVSTTEDALFTESMELAAGGQGFLFAPQRVLRATPADARAEVLRHLESASRPQMFVEVCAQLAVKFGPDLREKHHKAAVRELVQERRIIGDPPGKLERDTLLRLDHSR